MEPMAVERLGLPRDCLKGRVAVVTGAGRGIGREAARAFAWLGAAVIIAELSDSGMETEKTIRAEGGKAHFLRTDVSDPTSIAQLFRGTTALFGTPDILVNNAMLCPVISVLEMTVEQWDQVMAVNLRGMFLTTRTFLPGMISKKRGTIINMISAEAMPYLSAYITSKQGMQAFSQSLAAEVGEAGIRVIALAPGLVDTPAIQEKASALAPRLGLTPDQFLHLSLHPAYEGLMPADHAGAATAYLAARLADQYHGETVTGYEVLEMAGFLRVEPLPAAPQPSEAEPLTSTGRIQARHVMTLARQLQQMLEETETELNKLPVVVRPLARRGFKGKAGKSLQEWQHTAGLLVEWLGRADAGLVIKREFPGLKQSLGMLGNYYRETPAELARFTKDRKVLETAQRLSDERLCLLDDLTEMLQAVTIH